MLAAIERLRCNLAREEYEVEEEVSCTVFTGFVIQIRGYLLDLIFNYEFMERESRN
jgi:hypothetical protein